MKKIIGAIIVFIFIVLVIVGFVYNIYIGGWVYILSLLLMFALFGIFLIGINLLSDDE